MQRLLIPFLFFLALACSAAAAQEKQATIELEARTFSPADAPKDALKYRYLAPPKIEAGKKYPLLLCLHGAGERGDDNGSQVGHFRPLFGTGETREKYPCFVVIPQVPNGQIWATYGWSTRTETMSDKPSATLALTKALVEELIKKEAVDPSRIYVTGLSMGGYGTWEMIQRYPNFFAAAAPVCGGGDVSKARDVAGVPIWAHHGDKDGVIKPEKTGAMIDAIKAAGGEPKYTLYKNVGHDSWNPAYRDPELLKWMFAQKLDAKKTDALKK